MSHITADFVGYLQECKRDIKRFVGQTHYNVHIGTLKWYWEDDQEITKIPNPKIIIHCRERGKTIIVTALGSVPKGFQT